MKGIHVDFKTIDLFLLSFMAIGSEVLSNVLMNHYSEAGFFISFSYLIVLIALVRWREKGMFVNVALTIPLVLFSETITVGLVFYYLLTSVFVAVIPFVNDKVSHFLRRKSYLDMAVTFYLVTLFARGVFSFLIGLTPIEAIQQTMLQLNFSVLISGLVLLLLKNTEGLLVNLVDSNEDSVEVVE
ncbi:hypothetical protein SAMN05421839_13015 [Halolactibacillus halophilus]|uniref:Uncharacterized protein n=1 Tax=Halolactibacillus halophilus TaxID=306540 RepID=A0A1I5RH59_9BACI|nr:hypothetical protein [Halolactibacillus halophilus]GEM02355.1 hypothetical protein HHA03_18870 [Halolactibacillus halophilus]SFP57873.1 hypothetical protein SAMN05421839_13015 [Halolactibacillus halophilus]